MSRIPIGPVKLPSGKEIFFVEPLGSDRSEIMSLAIAQDRAAQMMFMLNGYWLPARCVVDAQGQFLYPDVFHAFDIWPDLDIQFYRVVFDTLFGVNEADVMAAKTSAARFLPQAPTSSAS